MFRNLRTGTKLLILCGAFILAMAVPIYGLVTEKQIAIEFARKELVGSRYLGAVRDIYASLLAVPQGGSVEATVNPADANLKQLADLSSGADGQFDNASLLEHWRAHCAKWSSARRPVWIRTNCWRKHFPRHNHWLSGSAMIRTWRSTRTWIATMSKTLSCAGCQVFSAG